MLQITYQKRDGSIFQKYRETTPPYKIGEYTSMGWKLLNIEYEYQNNYYSAHEYYALLQKCKEKYLKKKSNIKAFKKEIKTFMYYFIAIIIVNLLKALLGI